VCSRIPVNGLLKSRVQGTLGLMRVTTKRGRGNGTTTYRKDRKNEKSHRTYIAQLAYEEKRVKPS